MFWPFNKCVAANISELKPILLTSAMLTELKKRTKILLIDDEDEALPIQDLRKDGFTIEQEKNIDQQLLSKIISGDYDIVVLDIKGIAKPSFNKDDGFGVLQHIKERRPSQIIIAFSSKKFDPEKHKFFTMADDVMAKPISFVSCKENLEGIITEKININYFWKSIEVFLEQNNVPKKKIKSVEKKLICAIERNKTPELSDILKGINETVSSSAVLIEFFNNIIKFIGVTA